jgi:uncharacterized protein
MTAAASAAPQVRSDQAIRVASAFAAVLRGAGLAVPLGTVVTYAEALGVVGMSARGGVYWAGRAVLVRRPEDIALYDRAFLAFYLSRTPRGPEEVSIEIPVTLAVDDDEDGEGDESGDEEETPQGEIQTVRFSAVEILRNKDFSDYTDEEFDEARKVMAFLKVLGSPRRCRRMVPMARGGERLDVRRTVRRALRSEGEPIERRWLVAGTKPRRIVLLLDVSGSMESYARALLRFCQAAVVGRGRVEVFALGTRLTRVTRELSSRDPDTALAKASKRVIDWSGGTRLGEGVRLFNDQWGVRGMARQAIVVILSDGWDRGEPELLAEQMQRLHRVAHKVVWVNPLKAAPGYAPLARGMAAALPHIDHFIAGHNIASLETLAAVLRDDLS